MTNTPLVTWTHDYRYIININHKQCVKTLVSSCSSSAVTALTWHDMTAHAQFLYCLPSLYELGP